MLKFLILFLFPLVSFARQNFIVGIDSQIKKNLEVEVALVLEASNSLCTEITWNPFSSRPSVRDLIPIPISKTKEIVQTQKVNDDVYEYAFEYDQGFCSYKMSAVRVRVTSFAISEKWSKSYFIRPLNNADATDVVISLGENKGNVHWRTFIMTPGSPQVMVVLKE